MTGINTNVEGKQTPHPRRYRAARRPTASGATRWRPGLRGHGAEPRVTRRIDPAKARVAFERAAAGTREGFGDFFLARLLGLEISYPGEACEVAFDAADFLSNRRAPCTAASWRG